MLSETCQIPLADLVRLAEQHGYTPDRGYKISRQWMSKYARLGLLPDQLPLPGLGRGVGKYPVYSAATVRQLVPLLNALNHHGKNLSLVGWSLWCGGYSVHERYWREPLAEAAEKIERVKSALKYGDATLSTDGETLLQEAAKRIFNSRSSGPVFGAAKRHLGGMALELLATISSVVLGTYLPIQALSHDQYETKQSVRIISKGLSVPEDVDTSETRYPIDVAGMDEQLAKLNRIAYVNMREFLASRTDEEIHAARDELMPIINAVVATEVHTQRSQGRTLGAKTLALLWRRPQTQAAVLVGWLWRRTDPEIHEGAQKLLAAIRDIFARSEIGGKDDSEI